MGTTEGYVKQQIKERHRRFLRRHWWRLGLMFLAIAGLGAAIYLVAPGVEVPLWGAVPATALAALGAGWDQLAGTYNLVNGRDAEKWTSKELRRACGRRWQVIDGLPFDSYDVDHVLVGPGGVYAIETKYTDGIVDLSSQKGSKVARGWIGQARRSARCVTSVLEGLEVEVHAAVVVWGNEVGHTPYVDAGTDVLHGRDIAGDALWGRCGDVLTGDEVGSIVEALLRYRDDWPARGTAAA